MKNIFLLIILITFTQCGYGPIYSQNKQNFEINKIELNIDNKLLENRLKNYKNNNNTIFYYNLKINALENKSVISKNAEGKALLLRINIKLNVEVFEKEKLLMQKNYINNFDYQNMNKKFELSNYEEQIRIDIYNEIASKMLIDLANLK